MQDPFTMKPLNLTRQTLILDSHKMVGNFLYGVNILLGWNCYIFFSEMKNGEDWDQNQKPGEMVEIGLFQNSMKEIG